MRLALHALFCNDRDFSDDGVRKRAQIEKDLRNNERSAEFFRKLRLAASDPNLKAPEIFSPEVYPDPNVVAEYLDCQLESSAVATDYENACLNSPEMLAEVGDCYDVLTNKLPQQIDPPKNCRRRLYALAYQDLDAPVEDLPEPVEELRAPRDVVESAPEETWRFEREESPAAFERVLDSERFVVEDVETVASSAASSKPSQRRRSSTKSDPKSDEELKEKPKTRTRTEKSKLGLGLKSILALFVVLGAARLSFNLRALNSDESPNPVATSSPVLEPSADFEEETDVSVTSNFTPFSDQLVSAEDEPYEGEFPSNAPNVSAPPKIASRPEDEGAPESTPLREGLRDQIDLPESNNDVFSRGNVF